MKIKLSLAALVAMSVIGTGLHAADSLEGMFKNGKVSGEVRFNSFMWDWDKIDDSSATTGNKVDPASRVAAIGGSVVFKTDKYAGVSLGLGAYTSQPISDLYVNGTKTKSGGDLDLKSGTLCGGSCEAKPINVFTQSYVQYDRSKTTAILGRQLMQTPLTGINDSKMVPNAFEALTVKSKDIKDFEIFGAYVTAMKPRFSDTFEDVMSNFQDVPKALATKQFNIGAGNANSTDYMGIIGVTYTGVKDLKLEAWDYEVSDILNTMILEANYSFPVYHAKVTVGGRYINQMDNNNINNDASWGWGQAANRSFGYSNPNSLDAQAYMARIFATQGAYKIHFGYSQIADEADLVTGWRNFPTFGYTRPMKTENWEAGTSSWMVAGSADLGKAGLLKDTKIDLNYLVDDRDEDKSLNKGDMTTVTMDINYKIAKNLNLRYRLGYHDDKGNAYYFSNTAGVKTTNLAAFDFTEHRVDLSYKF